MDAEDIRVSYSKEKLLESARTFRKLGEVCADCNIAGQLCLMSEILEDCIASGEELRAPDREVQEGVTKLLARRGIKVKNISIFACPERPLEVILQARTLRNGSVNSKEIGECLGECFRCGFAGADSNRKLVNGCYHDYIFVQVPRYQMLTGTAFAAAQEKNLSGDNYSIAQVSGGKLVVTLADGMGSGAMARRESQVVIELLEQSMDAGFDVKQALGLINIAIASGFEEHHPVTIDTCIIDRYLGVANFVKMGAASTFIKRDGWVEIIRSTTLPIGVFEEMDYDNTTKKLYNNDTVIMMSDGMLDALPGEDKEEQMVQIIQSIDVKAPDLFAELLCDAVNRCTDGMVADDRSVIVVGIFDTVPNIY